MESSSIPTVAVASRLERNQSRLVELAEFWKIPYTTSPTNSQDGVTISSGRIDASKTGSTPIIVSPTGPQDFQRIASDFGLGLRTDETLLHIPVTQVSKVAIRATVREFTGSRVHPLLNFGGKRILSRIEGTGIHLLSLDLVDEYERRLYDRLEDAPAERFKIIAKLPLPYGIVPSRVRNWSLRRAMSGESSYDENIGAVDSLRILFLACIVTVLGRPIPRIAFWKRGKSYSMAITHDVETRWGLETGSKQLLSVEGELGVRSTWNIPSDRYPLRADSLRTLGGAGDIGAHDTVHDGKLILAALPEKISRVNQAKEKLQRLTGTTVRGFRAPLLQHSSELLAAVAKAGYEYDSSVPSWEQLSPTSLKSHGVGTVFPFEFDGILEIPVSLPQDHQLLKIQEMTPNEAVDHTSQLAKWMSGLGGACVILVHPDYDYALERNEVDYRHLVEGFRRDSSCDVMTMKEMADWWKRRSSARIEWVQGQPQIVSKDSIQGDTGLEDLQIEFVTGYDDAGFRVEGQP